MAPNRPATRQAAAVGNVTYQQQYRRCGKASCSRCALFTVADSHANVPEACRRGTLRGAPGLHRLAFAAIRCSPRDPRTLIRNGITRVPKLRGNAGVRRILEHTAALAVFHFPSDLASELEVQAMIVN